MKRAIQGNGLLLAKSLYAGNAKTTANLANPTDNYHIGRPAIIPGVPYPTTQKEEQLLDAAWNHAVKLKVLL